VAPRQRGATPTRRTPGFKIGAAIRAPSGAIYAAANVENAAYPQGRRAEASH
jgi:cytidine deaminase